MVNTCLLYAVACVFALFSGVQNINPEANIFLMEYTLIKRIKSDCIVYIYTVQTVFNKVLSN